MSKSERYIPMVQRWSYFNECS